MKTHRICHFVLCTALSACSGSGLEPEPALSEQPLQDPSAILGFESLGLWSATTATLTSEASHTQGSKSLGVGNFSFASLTSAALATPSNVSNRVRLDLQLSAPGSSDQLWLYASIPSRQKYKSFIEYKSLSGLPANTWTTIDFEIPEVLLTELRATYQDLTFTLELSSPSTQRKFLLDNLRFVSPGPGPVNSPGPVNLKAFVGGDDIALTWDAAPSPVLKYQVLRDGVVVGDVLPNDRPLVTRASFIDPGVVPGRAYDYQVATVDLSGNSSAWSAALSVTQPVSRVPKPLVTYDDAATPTARWYFEAGKRTLEVWYPKIAQLIADPDHLPPSTLKILAKTCSGGGWVGASQVLEICGGGADPSPPLNIDTGLFVHEATHIIQAYQTQSLWAIQEGIASWAGDLSQGITRPLSIFDAGLTYLNGYEYSGVFYAWIEKARNLPAFVRNMNLRSHEADFEFSWFQEETGETVAELWKGMTGVELSLAGSLISNTGLCVKTSDHLQLTGTPLSVAACGQHDNDKQVIYEPGLKRIHVDAHCMGVDGSWVTYQACSKAGLATWAYQNGSWVEQATGRCLQALTGSGPYKDRLVTGQCNPTVAAQKWNFLP